VALSSSCRKVSAPFVATVLFVLPTLAVLAAPPAVAVDRNVAMAGTMPGQREVDLAAHDADRLHLDPERRPTSFALASSKT
jgi:hypothetical protein